jgi:hypothetical protein
MPLLVKMREVCLSGGWRKLLFIPCITIHSIKKKRHFNLHRFTLTLLSPHGDLRPFTRSIIARGVEEEYKILFGEPEGKRSLE